MKLSFTTIATGVLLTTATVILTATPLRSFLCNNIFGANQKFKPWGKAKKRKKPHPCEICSVSILAHESVQDRIGDEIIPELSILTGMNFLVLGRDFLPGCCRVNCFRQALAETSATLVIVDHSLLADAPGWLNYTLAHSLQMNHPLYLCIDANFHFQTLPQSLQNLVRSQRATLVTLDRPNQLAQTIASTLQQPQNSYLTNLTPNKISCIERNNPMQHDAYLMFDGQSFDFFNLTTHLLQNLYDPGILTLTSSSDLLPGGYLYHRYGDVISSARCVVVLLTNQLIQDPLFEYQLGLALHCRGNRGVIFVLDQNNPVQIQIERDSILEYALYVCRKVVL